MKISSAYRLCLKGHALMKEVLLFTLKSKGIVYEQKLSQLTFTYSKSIVEALEKGVKYVQSWQFVLVFLLLNLNK